MKKKKFKLERKKNKVKSNFLKKTARGSAKFAINCHLRKFSNMKNKKRKHEKDSYNTIEEAVAAIFLNKKDRKRMFSVLFSLSLVGALIVLTGTHFLLKQQAVIDQNSDIDWKNQHTFARQLKGKTELIGDDESQEKNQSSEVDKEEYIQNSFKNDTLEVFFLGDLMLDRYNRELMERKGDGWMTERVRHLFLEKDLNVANLEGPVTTDQSVSVGSEEGVKNNFIFTFDPDGTRNFLQDNKINLVNLGNNHILNFGKKGFTQTKKFLSQNNFGYFGDISGEDDIFIEKNINGIKVAFISYNQFSGNGFDEIKRKVEDLEKLNDLTIVYAHWGSEYELEENKQQREEAHEFIDAGADLIIGSHPHVVQPVEMYNKRAIFYSLGNFIFDQYFSEDTMVGLGVNVSIAKTKELDFTLTPLQLQRNGQVDFATDEQENKLLNRILKSKETRAEMSL